MSDGSHVVRAMSTPYPAVLTGLELGTYRHVAALAQRLFDVPLAAVVLSDGQRHVDHRRHVVEQERAARRAAAEARNCPRSFTQPPDLDSG